MPKDEDRIYYRKAVTDLIRGNKNKYPVLNEAVALSFMQGTITTSAVVLGQMFDACFNQNMPIGECARLAEEISSFAKEKAQEVLLTSMTEGETKH